ncbi:hypothetical protein RB195_015110 [Necator americanus]|uniref:Uncharacterized protein n=1 Tax=Necator americanus TaxID=51031 RepID=A0ABR1E3K7_NECAM
MEWWILILSSLLFKPEWGSANITQVTDVVTAAPAKRNRHATIICTVMSSSELLEKLADTKGSITSLNIDAKVFSKDPFATCSRPMCSLKERITMDDELEKWEDFRLSLRVANSKDACKRLRSAASRYNTIPLLFAESHKWEEIYNSSDNHNTYTSGTENEKQELLRDIAREFQSVWDSFISTHGNTHTTPGLNYEEIVIEFPRFENRAKIIMPSEMSYITARSYVIMGLLASILLLSVIILSCGVYQLRTKKSK